MCANYEFYSEISIGCFNFTEGYTFACWILFGATSKYYHWLMKMRYYLALLLQFANPELYYQPYARIRYDKA